MVLYIQCWPMAMMYYYSNPLEYNGKTSFLPPVALCRTANEESTTRILWRIIHHLGHFGQIGLYD